MNFQTEKSKILNRVPRYMAQCQPFVQCLYISHNKKKCAPQGGSPSVPNPCSEFPKPRIFQHFKKIWFMELALITIQRDFQSICAPHEAYFVHISGNPYKFPKKKNRIKIQYNIKNVYFILNLSDMTCITLTEVFPCFLLSCKAKYQDITSQDRERSALFPNCCVVLCFF